MSPTIVVLCVVAIVGLLAVFFISRAIIRFSESVVVKYTGKAHFKSQATLVESEVKGCAFRPLTSDQVDWESYETPTLLSATRMRTLAESRLTRKLEKASAN